MKQNMDKHLIYSPIQQMKALKAQMLDKNENYFLDICSTSHHMFFTNLRACFHQVMIPDLYVLWLPSYTVPLPRML